MSIFGFGKKKTVDGAPKERLKPRPKLEGREEKPDTLKPNVDKVTKPNLPEKPKPITVKVPDETVKLISELGDKKNGLMNQFLSLSIQVVEYQIHQKTLLEELKKAGRRIRQEVDFAGTKLKLNKGYRWQYDGKGNFVGILKPKPKEQPKK